MAEWLDSKVRGVGNIFNDVMGISAQNAANAQQAKFAQDFSAAEAEKNRQWQAGQSATAHQREVADLRAAGLNPILSGTGGMGAQTGGGSMGQSSMARMERANPLEAVTSALDVRRQNYEVKNLKEMNTNIRADTDKKASERALNSITYNRVVEEVERERALKQIDQDRAKGAKVEGEIDSGRYGAALRYLDRLRGTTSSATQFMRAVK